MTYAIRMNNYCGLDFYLCHDDFDYPNRLVWMLPRHITKRAIFSKEVAEKKVATLRKENPTRSYVLEEAC